MKTHELKILDCFYAEVICGNKTYEIRGNDRNFQQGDAVVLREINDDRDYTGRSCKAEIGYVCDYGQPIGQVVFSLLNVEVLV
jgi:uncharacterized protein YqfB (UPF0267 family)